MDATLTTRQLQRLLVARPVLAAVAVLVGLPLLLLLAGALYFWGTAASFAHYQPAAPSRLYAAPFEVRPGGAMRGAVLGEALEALGYRAAEPLVAGTYQRDGGRFRLALRSDDASVDGLPPLGGARVEIAVDGGRVSEVRVGALELSADQTLRLGRPLLYSYHDEERRETWPVRLEDLPDHVIHAVLAAEDARFFRHSGVAPVGIARAALHNARAGEVRQGGSTITQQLVKNLYLSPKRTVARKGREAVLAVLLEARFGKDRILEAYLNEIYWGHADGLNLHGIGAAARAYFGKPPSELDVGEAATLAGMIRAPAALSPLTHPEAARARRDWVLHRMAEARWLDRARLADETARPFAPRPGGRPAQRAPYFAVAAADEARERFGIDAIAGAGLRLESTLSFADQRAAEEEVRAGLARLERTWERDGGRLESALVSLDPESGRVLAWVGGRDWRRSQFDRVVRARRQAGSLFKPIVYAAALQRGRLTPWETLRDTPILVRQDRTEWRPRNSDGGFRGEVTARQALEQSLNVPAVRIAMRTGIQQVRATARDMGIVSEMPAVPSLALGACETTPLELAVVYGTLATSGRRPSPWMVESVLDPTGEPLEGEAIPDAERVLPAETAYMVTSMLRGVLARGTAWSARELGVRGPLAGKTGTTDDRRDSWFAGYSADRVTVVWVGYDDNSHTRLSGTRGALPLWARFTASVEPAGGYRAVEPPQGFVTVDVDPSTGMLAGAWCPRKTREELPGWRAPLRECTLHQPMQLAYHQGLVYDSRVSVQVEPARPSGTLQDLLTSGAPQAPPVRLRDDVVGLFGEGDSIRVEGPAAPALEVVARPGAAPVPVAPREVVPVRPPDPPAPLTPGVTEATGAQRR